MDSGEENVQSVRYLDDNYKLNLNNLEIWAWIWAHTNDLDLRAFAS